MEDSYCKETLQFVLSSLNTTHNNLFAHPVYVIKIGHGDYAANGSLTTPKLVKHLARGVQHNIIMDLR